MQKLFTALGVVSGGVHAEACGTCAHSACAGGEALACCGVCANVNCGVAQISLQGRIDIAGASAGDA